MFEKGREGAATGLAGRRSKGFAVDATDAEADAALVVAVPLLKLTLVDAILLERPSIATLDLPRLAEDHDGAKRGDD